MGTKGINDLSALDKELSTEMQEKAIDEKELEDLVIIDSLQQQLVHLRTKKFAQDLIKKLSS